MLPTTLVLRIHFGLFQEMPVCVIKLGINSRRGNKQLRKLTHDFLQKLNHVQQMQHALVNSHKHQAEFIVEAPLQGVASARGIVLERRVTGALFQETCADEGVHGGALERLADLQARP